MQGKLIRSNTDWIAGDFRCTYSASISFVIVGAFPVRRTRCCSGFVDRNSRGRADKSAHGSSARVCSPSGHYRLSGTRSLASETYITHSTHNIYFLLPSLGEKKPVKINTMVTTSSSEESIETLENSKLSKGLTNTQVSTCTVESQSDDKRCWVLTTLIDSKK